MQITICRTRFAAWLAGPVTEGFANARRMAPVHAAACDPAIHETVDSRSRLGLAERI
jgi:hypothetical protein